MTKARHVVRRALDQATSRAVVVGIVGRFEREFVDEAAAFPGLARNRTFLGYDFCNGLWQSMTKS